MSEKKKTRSQGKRCAEESFGWCRRVAEKVCYRSENEKVIIRRVFEYRKDYRTSLDKMWRKQRRPSTHRRGEQKRETGVKIKKQEGWTRQILPLNLGEEGKPRFRGARNMVWGAGKAFREERIPQRIAPRGSAKLKRPRDELLGRHKPLGILGRRKFGGTEEGGGSKAAKEDTAFRIRARFLSHSGRGRLLLVGGGRMGGGSLSEGSERREGHRTKSNTAPKMVGLKSKEKGQGATETEC